MLFEAILKFFNVKIIFKREMRKYTIRDTKNKKP